MWICSFTFVVQVPKRSELPQPLSLTWAYAETLRAGPKDRSSREQGPILRPMGWDQGREKLPDLERRSRQDELSAGHAGSLCSAPLHYLKIFIIMIELKKSLPQIRDSSYHMC